MPADSPIVLFFDTDTIKGATFKDANLQIIFKHSKDGNAIVFVSRIVWEELKAQHIDELNGKQLQTLSAFKNMKRLSDNHFSSINLPFDSYTPIAIEGIREKVSQEFEQFAQDNCIEILECEPVHSERFWNRYFSQQMPFDKEYAKREDRRKDIPDAWILESGIDLLRRHENAIAVSGDKNLRNSLQYIGMTIVGEPGQHRDNVSAALQIIEAKISCRHSNDIEPILTTEFATEPEMAVKTAQDAAETSDKFEKLLTRTNKKYMALQKRIYGFVHAIEDFPKEGLYEYFCDDEYSYREVKMIAEKLVLDGLIQDTGNYFIPIQNDSFSDAIAEALSFIEDELIVMSEGSDE